MENAAVRLANGSMSRERYNQIAGRVNRTTQNYLRNIRERTGLVNRLTNALADNNISARDRALNRGYSRRTYMGVSNG